eukprot:6901148-Prymnesium_polylepis.1
MSRKIADVFADPEDAEATAATVEAQLSDWLDEPPTPVEATEVPAQPPPVESAGEAPPAEAAAEAAPAEAAAEPPLKVEYSTAERSQRIAELEDFWQGR